MLILPKLEPPNLPLMVDDDTYKITSVINYLQSLIDYLYNCNALLADTVLGEGQGSAVYNTGSFTVTGTGFSGTAPSGTAQYIQIGKQVTVFLPAIQGTSNATTFTITGILPSIAAAYLSYSTIPTFDNTFAINGMIQLSASGTTWTLFRDSLGNIWTPSGAKGTREFAISYISI